MCEGAATAVNGFLLFLAFMGLAFAYIEVTRKPDAPPQPEKK